ncbi:S-adenosyl-L-methionine-dependent methyltransferase [Phlyctochytrium arcticum]|nr:S-adenosyl-L-methionine-dependent methyltransferase [Phlyctochytrium arcticum]
MRLTSSLRTVSFAGRRLQAGLPRRSIATSVDQSEIAKFARAAQDWWNPRGEFEMLHRMNPVRVRYVRDTLEDMRRQDLVAASETHPLKNIRMLDIGCGGGLLSESLALLGANVVGADAAKENIQMASLHAEQNPLLRENPSLSYVHATAESLASQGQKFDAICALEIIEHVVDPAAFIKTCGELLKPRGVLFLSTINRTTSSYLLTILLAEHVFKWVPPGTHEHAKYVTPEEMDKYLRDGGCEPLDIKGMAYNPLTNNWRVLESGITDLQMNYIVTAQKNSPST